MSKFLRIMRTRLSCRGRFATPQVKTFFEFTKHDASLVLHRKACGYVFISLSVVVFVANRIRYTRSRTRTYEYTFLHVSIVHPRRPEIR